MRDTYWLEQLDEQCLEHNREVDGLYKRVADLEQLVLDMCQAYECGGGCVMYDECQHWNDDRCPMEERMKALGIEVDE